VGFFLKTALLKVESLALVFVIIIGPKLQDESVYTAIGDEIS
jgi:hypothetical protein